MDKNSISERIRLVREAANLKQEGFAQATGVTNVTISRYEKGHRTPDADFLNHLVELYGCDPGWLLTGKGKMKADFSYKTAAGGLMIGEIKAPEYLVLSDLEEILLRILKEGDKTKTKAVRAVLSAFDPGEK